MMLATANARNGMPRAGLKRSIAPSRPSDATCRQILGNVRATMPRGARIVCIDQRLDRDRPSSISSLVDLHMLVVCEGGRERSPQEVHELMRSVGLRPGRVRHSGLHMLVEGIADG